MYIFGGRSDLSAGLMNTEFYTNKLHYLDTLALKWNAPKIANLQAKDIPEGRRSHSALNVDGKLVIFGGYNGKTLKHFDDLWSYDPDTSVWSKLNPARSGATESPKARRRQAMIKVGGRIYLFGGTSPYNGPPIQFTPAQLEFIPNEIETQLGVQLIDHNDLFILDLDPNLATLCMCKVLDHGLDWSMLPHFIKKDLVNLTTDNNISRELKTLANG